MKDLRIERNEKIDVNELNNLLKSIGWGINSSKILQESLNLSWGWITVRNETNKLLAIFIK